MQINPVMTLNKRREALKRLAKNPETTVKEFHALLGDATEDERAVLAKTLPPAKVLGRGNRAVLSPVGGYLLAALGANPAGHISVSWIYIQTVHGRRAEATLTLSITLMTLSCAVYTWGSPDAAIRGFWII